MSPIGMQTKAPLAARFVISKALAPLLIRYGQVRARRSQRAAPVATEDDPSEAEAQAEDVEVAPRPAETKWTRRKRTKIHSLAS